MMGVRGSSFSRGKRSFSWHVRPPYYRPLHRVPTHGHLIKGVIREVLSSNLWDERWSHLGTCVLAKRMGRKRNIEYDGTSYAQLRQAKRRNVLLQRGNEESYKVRQKQKE